MPSVRSPFVVEHLAKARAAWPTLEWAEDDYVAWLTESLGEELDSGLAALVPGDVLLCWAAARGDPAAHRLFHAHFMPHVSSAVRRFRESDAFTDEVIQRVLMKTLMPRHGEALAPIAGLALRGNVHGLMRVAAVREAVSLRRGDKPAAPVEELTCW